MQFKTAGKPGQQVPPAQTAQERKKAGLDAVLQSLQKVKKVNVLDKSRMDWGDFKSTDTQVSCHIYYNPYSFHLPLEQAA